MSVRPLHHQRPLACAAAAYGIGVWAGVLFAWRPGLYLLGLAAAGGSMALLRRMGRHVALGAMGAALFLGMLMGGYAAHPALPPAGRYQVEGVAAADFVLREDGTAAGYLEQVLVQDETESRRMHRVYWTYTPEEEAPFLPREGDRVSFSGRLYHPQGQVNPYGFDFRMFLLQKGAAAGVSGAKDPLVTGHPGRGIASALYGLKKSLDQRLQAVFGADSALPRALLLGQREDLPQETVQGFSDAGVAHVLSVSGLHVALLAGMLLMLLKRVLPPRPRWIVLGLFLLMYCALLGFSAPVVRAAVLMMLGEGRRMLRRAPDPVTTLSAAFFLILLVRPLDLFSASFQLSFCAVLGMAVFLPQAQRLLGRLQPSFLRDGIGVTWCATLGAALPTIQWFHRFSLIGLLINPMVCAVFGVLLPLYVLVLTVGCVYLPAGLALAAPVGWITRAVTAAVQWLGALPFATVRVPYLPWYCVLAVIFFLALASRWTVWQRKTKALFAAALLLCSFGAWRLTLCRDVQYVQLAAGQADTALILEEGETVVLDAGEYGGDLASYLLATGRQADTVILSHLHRDHCMGLQQLMDQRLPVGRIFLPEGAEEQSIDGACLQLLNEVRAMGIPVQTLHAGDEITLPRGKLTVAWPLSGTVRPGQDANRYCLALLAELDGVRLWTGGDLTGDFELYAAADADVLKVSHHGSKNSTGTEFLNRVTPKIAILPANGFSENLPHPDTLERLREAGTAIYNTGETGALTVTIRQGEAHVTPYLNAKEQP